MKVKRISKYLVIFSTIATVSLNTLVLSSTDAFASEEYRLEFFNQLADKVTSLYFKEAIVGLDIIDNVYSDEMLSNNIENRLNKDAGTKLYLLERGFDLEKVKEVTLFINSMFPSVEDVVKNKEETNNIIEKLIRTTLIEENGTLSYDEYEDDIVNFGEEFYKVMPNGVKDSFDKHFKTNEEKRDAMIKIMVEYIYSGHGKGTYDEETQEYRNLELEIDDNFIHNVNTIFGVEILNEKTKYAINIFLGGLEDTIKKKELDRVYSDISSVLNLVDTNFIKELREESIESDFEDTKAKIVISEVKEKDINRSEILKLTFSLIDTEVTEYDGEFLDVDKDDFYADYIATGKSIGLINGYKDNTFRPNSKVTRSEMMSMLSNTMNYVDGETKLSYEEIEILLKDFKYKNDIEDWAREDVAKLVKLGVIDKVYDKKFGVDEFITRDEAMSIIDKIESLKGNN